MNYTHFQCFCQAKLENSDNNCYTKEVKISPQPISNPETQTSTSAKITLPANFLLGAATSAHQVEGDNINSDWWYWEKQGKLPESGLAADHYHKFDNDFGLAQQIGLNAFRISIEWARIEPSENRFETREVEHYLKVLQSLKEHNLTRMVTLWHFTLPMWAAEKGGFENPEVVEAFARFAWFIAQNLGEEIDLWCTLNEPELYAGLSYSKGIWPPFKQINILAFMVMRNLVQAHKRAYLAIKQVRPQAIVGIAKNAVYYEAYRPKNILDQIVKFFSNAFGNHYFLNRIRKELDFVGVNYYFYNSMMFSWPTKILEMNFNFLKNRPTDPPEIQRSDMGWRTFPEGIFHVLKDLKRYGKPIYITENGIANARDDMRQDYIRQHLEWTAKAIAAGVDVRGYFYWSLIDNYEWADGYRPLFGLVEVNRETLARTIRPSAEIFKEVEVANSDSNQ